MILTKAQFTHQNEVSELLASKDTFTFEETERIYSEYNEGLLGNVSLNSGYFTNLELAYDFALMSIYRSGTILDMCSGFSVICGAALVRDSYDHTK